MNIENLMLTGTKSCGGSRLFVPNPCKGKSICGVHSKSLNNRTHLYAPITNPYAPVRTHPWTLYAPIMNQYALSTHSVRTSTHQYAPVRTNMNRYEPIR